MAKVYWARVYIDKHPDDIYKGWGWLEVNVEDKKRLNIPEYPESYTKTKNQMPPEERFKISGRGNLPSRGRSGTKKFNIDIDGEIITIRAQKSLSNRAVCAWVKSWASPKTKIITPGNRELSTEGEKLTHEIHFVYFIHNKDR